MGSIAFRDLAQLALGILQQVRVSARTAVVARVQSWDAQRQTVSALPSVLHQTLREDGTTVDGPSVPVHRVPVVLPGGPKRGITWGVEAEDPLVLLVRDRSHVEVDAGGVVPASPKATRTTDLADAVGLPGYVVPATGQPAAHRNADGELTLYAPSGESIRAGAGDAAFDVSRADRVDAQLAQIRDLLSGTGWVPVPNDGGAALLAAATALWAAPSPTTGTPRLKVDE